MLKPGMLTMSLVLAMIGLAEPVAAEGNPQAGKKVYDLWCGICHDPGPGYPGTQMLRLSRGEQFAVMKDNDTLAAPYIEIVVRKGLGMMPVFRKTEISDSELADLVAYIQSDM